MDTKVVLGIIGGVISIIGTIPYIRDVIKGKTKPHVFTWLIWSIIVSVVFFGQLADNGGPGAWMTGVTALLVFAVFILSIKKGEREITLSDKVSFGGAIFGIGLWALTKSPLYTIIIVTAVDMLGYYPTIRKSYYKPHQETLISYIISAFTLSISILALTNYSIITTLYPVSIIITNSCFSAMLIVRRRQLAAK